MQLEVGSILEGRVTGITKFGAFVELPGGKTGMVHISEVAPSYVKEISDHLTHNQTVKVKVIGVNPEGKVSLSIKQAAPAAPAAPSGARSFGGERGDRGNPGDRAGSERPARAPMQRRPMREQSYGFERRQPITSENMSFEDMMSKFKQASEDKMSDLKRYTEMKRGSMKGRNSSR